jgi:septum formation protein
MPPRRLVLASGSRYRREQLARLGLAVECRAADIDESPLAGELPPDTATRLALAKARAVAPHYPDALVIGSDQVAECAGRVLGKPGSAAAQQAQLLAASGRELRFHTALAILDTATRTAAGHLDLTVCTMRALTAEAIARYVAAEPAWDCAGGFKVEGRGIALFEAIRSEDPSALIGLPLIALCRMLDSAGIALP